MIKGQSGALVPRNRLRTGPPTQGRSFTRSPRVRPSATTTLAPTTASSSVLPSPVAKQALWERVRKWLGSHEL